MGESAFIADQIANESSSSTEVSSELTENLSNLESAIKTTQGQIENNGKIISVKGQIGSEFGNMAEIKKIQLAAFVLSDLTHNKVTVNITPKLGLYYFFDCMSVSLFNEYLASEGSEDGALCRFIDEQIDYGAEFFGSTRVEYLEDMGGVIGKQKWTFTDLKEDTEYIIVAASVNMSTGLIAYRKGFKSEVFRTGILIESDAFI